VLKLDEIDFRMLEVLQKNARISVLMLAERVNLSPTPCARRLRRLEEEGVIEKYTAVVNPKFLGFDVTAFVGVRVRHSPKWAAKLAAAMSQLPNLRGCYTVTGSYDFLLCVNLKDMASLTRWIHHDLYSIPQVLHSYTSIVLESIKADL
jgi:Lrp/AsnC family leucine-responsive transcriptional regulator